MNLKSKGMLVPLLAPPPGPKHQVKARDESQTRQEDEQPREAVVKTLRPSRVAVLRQQTSADHAQAIRYHRKR